MNRCPITYQPCTSKYSESGLKKLSPKLSGLKALEYSAENLRYEAAMRASHMSIQGVQPKLSTVLNVKEKRFDLVDQHGKYILKPQHHIFEQVPENEDLSMKLAKLAGIEVPLHGLIYSKDSSLTYFIKRFDRGSKNSKLAVEDFAQLAGLTRDTKYNYTVEKLIGLVDTYCTFPALEKLKLFNRILFNFIIGNEDMHLKNYSVIRKKSKIELTPAYDFLNTTILLKGETEESALKIKGKNKKLDKRVLIEYLGKERLKLSDKSIENTISTFQEVIPSFENLISVSFLSNENKEKYWYLVKERIERLDFI